MKISFSDLLHSVWHSPKPTLLFKKKKKKNPGGLFESNDFLCENQKEVFPPSFCKSAVFQWGKKIALLTIFLSLEAKHDFKLYLRDDPFSEIRGAEFIASQS